MSTNQNINFTYTPVNGQINRAEVLAAFEEYLDTEIEYHTSGAAKVRSEVASVFDSMGQEHLDKGIVRQQVMNSIAGINPSVEQWKQTTRLLDSYLGDCLIGSPKGSRMATAAECLLARQARAAKRAENKAKKAAAV
jgi:hypothetical protein